MNKLQKTFLIVILVFFCSGCAPLAAPPGKIGLLEGRKFVILNKATPNEAAQYSNKYNAPVFYSESRGLIADGVTKGMVATSGPSRAMNHLMNELRSISNTSKDWDFIVPENAESFFLCVLKHMESQAVTNCSGKINLEIPRKNIEIEKEVSRVFGDGFRVVYPVIN